MLSEYKKRDDIFDRKLHVLFIDDDIPFLEIITFFLKKYNFIQVYTVTDPACVIPLLENTQIDIIFSDNYMCELNGLELCTNLQNNGFDIPFILISGEREERIFNKILGLPAEPS